MKKINDLLKKYNIKANRYYKKGKSIIIESDIKKVIKVNKTNIYEYLSYRNFNNYPNIIIDSGYEISDYIDEIEIPREQKMIDLINVISTLHKKTTFYKKISDYNIEEIYDDIKKQINESRIFYDRMIYEAETSIYMRPSLYLLARNISFIYNMLNICDKNIELWFENIKKIDKVRVSIIHNNLSLEHFINNNLISWDNARISLPIFDLYKLYKETYNEYDWKELLDIYSNNYPLKEEELFLFNTLIGIPLLFNMTEIEMDNVKEVNNKLNYLKLTYKFIIETKSEIKI